MLVAQQFNDFVQFATEMSSFNQQSIGAPGEDFGFFPLRHRLPGFRDICAGSVAFGDHARVFQLQVSPGYGVGIDGELLRQNADGWKFLARLKSPRGDQMPHLIDNLLVNGNAISRGDS